jgi:hypothetical protein
MAVCQLHASLQTHLAVTFETSIMEMLDSSLGWFLAVLLSPFRKIPG